MFSFLLRITGDSFTSLKADNAVLTDYLSRARGVADRKDEAMPLKRFLQWLTQNNIDTYRCGGCGRTIRVSPQDTHKSLCMDWVQESGPPGRHDQTEYPHEELQQG
jgi:hypothetical protein